MRQVQISNALSGDIYTENCYRASGFLEKMIGLMGRGSIADNEGLLLENCGFIHTCFMRFPIDCVFLDHENRITRITGNLRPWRVSGTAKAVTVLEFPSGFTGKHGLIKGMEICIKDCT